VNCTQDYAYGDWCIAQVAKLCGKKDIAERYEKRAENYKNLFDCETGFMRSRDRDGKFFPAEDFDPFAWGGDYTEGSAWQNSFSVPQDYVGLAELYGGKTQFLQKIDELFAADPTEYRIGGYPLEIHEMTEMAAVDFGQCAISNQPCFHIPQSHICFLKLQEFAQSTAVHKISPSCANDVSFRKVPPGYRKALNPVCSRL
jgi:putative alpha-1,2-mannosidase